MIRIPAKNADTRKAVSYHLNAKTYTGMWNRQWDPTIYIKGPKEILPTYSYFRLPTGERDKLYIAMTNIRLRIW